MSRWLAAVGASVGFVLVASQTFAAGRGSVVAEAVVAIGAEPWQDNLAITGFGAKIAILDTGFIGYSTAVSLGEVPQVSGSYSPPGAGALEADSNHGTAVAEIVADLAPDAELYLVKAGTAGSWPLVRSYLAANQIKLVVAAIGYYGGCYWDDTCPINEMVNDSRLLDGAVWIVAAGNLRKGHRDNLAGGGQSVLSIVQGGTHPVDIYLNWDQYGTGECQSMYTLDIRDKNGAQVGDPPHGSPCSGGSKPERKASFTHKNEFAPYTITVTRTAGPPVSTTLVCALPQSGAACSLTNFVAARSMVNPAQATRAFAVTGCEVVGYSLLCTNEFFPKAPRRKGSSIPI